jgi:DNA topoisomerase-2
VPKKRSAVLDDGSDGGSLASTPSSAKKQKKAPAPKKAASKAKPLQPKENESEVDGDDFGELSDAPKAEGKKSSGDAYQKV